MADKKRLGHDPFSEPRGLDGLIRATGTQDAQAHTNTSAHDTQERKQKHPRINMAFAPDNLDYLRTMAGLDGVSITAYVNRLIEADWDARQAEYRQMQDVQGRTSREVAQIKTMRGKN